ncbi:MAG: hypothetical protein RIR79_1893 [Pseudomonadota bacterium]|jgi:protein-L-isoaspartate(D-aspartate) O-methyltransferase
MKPLNFDEARYLMIEQQIRPWNVEAPAVRNAFAAVKREDFVPFALRELAFAEIEIPLAQGQYMLAPFLEGRLLQEVMVQSSDTVLEIGAGSGFMAALLGTLAREVVSVEIIPELAAMAKHNLRSNGFVNVEVREQDGASLTEKDGTYDVIVLSGSVGAVPKNLLSMLKIGGRLGAVVGNTPIMRGTLVTRISATEFQTIEPWDVVAPRLRNFPEGKPQFQF